MVRTFGPRTGGKYGETRRVLRRRTSKNYWPKFTITVSPAWLWDAQNTPGGSCLTA